MVKFILPLVIFQVIFSANAVLPQEGCYSSEEMLTESGGVATLHMNFGPVVSFAVNTTDSEIVVCLSESAVVESVKAGDGETKLTLSIPLSDCLSKINDVIGGTSPAFPSVFQWRESLNIFLDAEYAITFKPSSSCPSALMAAPLTTSTTCEPVSRRNSVARSAVAEELTLKAAATNGEMDVPSHFFLPIIILVFVLY